MVSLADSPFTSSSSWNTPVPTNSSFTKLNWPASTGYNYSVAWDSYSPAVYVASASDPLVQVSYPPGWGYPGGTVSVHMPAAANGAAGTDGELIVIDNGVAYNFWQFKRTGTTSGTAASFGAENVTTGDGWGSKSPFLSAGITAVGASQLGGLIVKDETNDGSIDHALQLVVDSKLVQSGFMGQAIAGDGSSASGIVKEGQFLAISPNTPMPSGLSALGQQVFKAMQKYGAYVVDVAGGVTNVRAQSNAFDASTITALWHDMGKITPLLQGVNPGSGGSTGSGTTEPPVTNPPTTTNPPVTTNPPTTTNPPVTTNPPTTTNPPVTTNPPSGGGGSTADTTKPTLQWVAANGTGIRNGTGTVGEGKTVHFALKFSEAVNVTGTPTMSLNSSGTAKYVSGSGTDVLQFEYTVGAGDKASDLAISGFNFGGIKDKAGNVLNLAGAPHQPGGTLTVKTSATSGTIGKTRVNWIAANGPGVVNGTGTVGEGKTVRLSVNFNDTVNVTGTPTLKLNTNGTAKYVGGSGSNTLQFDYKVGAGEKASDLEVAGYNLNGVKDKAGNGINVAGAPHQPAGVLAIGTSAVANNVTSTNRSTSVTDTVAAPGAAAATNDPSNASNTGANQNNWSNFGNHAGSAFSRYSTLGYSGQSQDTGGNPAATDGSLMSRMALLGQYAASSFAKPGAVSTGPSLQREWANPIQTLAKSYG